MRFFSIYTPKNPPSGMPSPEMMQKMGALIAESMKSGVLESTGGLMRSEVGGLRITKAGAEVNVEAGPFVSQVQRAGGWAVLKVSSREELVAFTKRFLEVAGDGECDMLQVFEIP